MLLGTPALERRIAFMIAVRSVRGLPAPALGLEDELEDERDDVCSLLLDWLEAPRAAARAQEEREPFPVTTIGGTEGLNAPPMRRVLVCGGAGGAASGTTTTELLELGPPELEDPPDSPESPDEPPEPLDDPPPETPPEPLPADELPEEPEPEEPAFDDDPSFPLGMFDDGAPDEPEDPFEFVVGSAGGVDEGLDTPPNCGKGGTTGGGAGGAGGVVSGVGEELLVGGPCGEPPPAELSDGSEGFEGEAPAPLPASPLPEPPFCAPPVSAPGCVSARRIGLTIKGEMKGRNDD